MKRAIAIMMSSLFLSACASTADIDLSKVDETCGQACSKNYSECLGKFSLFPIQSQNQCTDAFRLCSKSCPPRSTSTASNGSAKPSVTEKMKELDSLHKSGLISDSEFETKRQEILKTL